MKSRAKRTRAAFTVTVVARARKVPPATALDAAAIAADVAAAAGVDTAAAF